MLSLGQIWQVYVAKCYIITIITISFVFRSLSGLSQVAFFWIIGLIWCFCFTSDYYLYLMRSSHVVNMVWLVAGRRNSTLDYCCGVVYHPAVKMSHHNLHFIEIIVSDTIFHTPFALGYHFYEMSKIQNTALVWNRNRIFTYLSLSNRLTLTRLVTWFRPFLDQTIARTLGIIHSDLESTHISSVHVVVKLYTSTALTSWFCEGRGW